jgi:D-psicose/D-tagatose/L-ribulose 3-epimerase
LHLSENDRGLLGTGHIDFPEILRAAIRMQYDGYLMLEGFGFSQDEPSAPGALWADESLSPEEFALQGLVYIRDLIH